MAHQGMKFWARQTGRAAVSIAINPPAAKATHRLLAKPLLAFRPRRFDLGKNRCLTLKSARFDSVAPLNAPQSLFTTEVFQHRHTEDTEQNQKIAVCRLRRFAKLQFIIDLPFSSVISVALG